MAEINPNIILAGLAGQQQPSLSQNIQTGISLAGQLQKQQLAPQRLALQEQQLQFDIRKQESDRLKQEADIKETLSKATKNQLENARGQIQLMGSLAGSVSDQGTLDLMRERFSNLPEDIRQASGITLEQIPTVFNPETQNTLSSFQRSALSEEEFLSNEIAKRSETTKEKLASIREEELEIKRDEADFKRGKVKRDFQFEQEKLTNQLGDVLKGKLIKGRVLTPNKIKEVTSLISVTPSVMDISQNIIDEVKKGGIAALPDARKAQLQSELRQLQAILKSPDFINLGVLTGPDLDFLDDITGDPTRFTEKINLFGGENRVAVRLESLLKNTRKQVNDKLNARGFSSLNEKDFGDLSLGVNFGSEEEARRAGFGNGDIITIGGVRGVLE